MQANILQIKRSLFLYFIPISLWILATYYYSPVEFSWTVSLFGILILSFGSVSFISLLESLPKSENKSSLPKLPMDPPPLEAKQITSEIITIDHSAEYLVEIEGLKSERAIQEDLLQKSHKEKEDLQTEIMNYLNSFQTLKHETNDKIEEYQHSITLLKDDHQKKELMIEQLKNQIQDLRYEMKTLIHLTEFDDKKFKSNFSEMEEDPVLQSIQGPITTIETARSFLQRCLYLSQKISSAYKRSYNTQPHLHDIRRLSDTLNREKIAPILIYNGKEEKFLYVSNEIKEISGFSPELFIQEFTRLVEPLNLWQKIQQELLTKAEAIEDIVLIRELGGKSQFTLIAGTISSGIFRDSIIAVLFQS